MCLLLILIITTIGEFAGMIYLSSMPAMASALHASEAQIQMTVTAYLFAFGFSALFYGPLSDAFGRRFTLLVSHFILIVASIFCFCSPNIFFLLFARLLQGIGAGGLAGMATSISRDVYEGKELAKVTSLISAAWALIPILAPFAGSYVQYTWGWRANFLLSAFYVTISLILCLFYYSETNKYIQREKFSFQKILISYFHLLLNPIFIYSTIIATLCYAVNIVFSTTSPFILQKDLGVSVLGYGKLVLVITSAYLLGSYLNALLLKKINIHTVTMASTVLLFLISMSGFLFLNNFYNLVFAITYNYLVIFLTGFIYPNVSTMCIINFRKNAGQVASLSASMQLLGCSISTAIVALFTYHLRSMLIIMYSILSLFIFLTYLFSLFKKYFHKEILATDADFISPLQSSEAHE